MNVLILIVSCCLVLSIGYFGVTAIFAKYGRTETVLEEYVTENETENTTEVTIWDRCSTVYLTENEVLSIGCQITGADTLQMMINYIYAKHGYKFEDGTNSNIYFQSQEWYTALEKKDVTYEELNEFERKNVDLIVQVLKELGYRK